MAAGLAVVASSSEEQAPKPIVPVERKLALTLPECAALTGLKMYQLRNAIWAGELAFIQEGRRGRYLVRREALEKFLRARERREARDG